MEIPADIGGIVKTVNVKNGQEVRAGDLLITIETINDEENKSKQTPKKQNAGVPPCQYTRTSCKLDSEKRNYKFYMLN